MHKTLLTTTLCLGTLCQAGTTPSSKAVMLPTVSEATEFGRITLGGKFSDDLQSGTLDVIQSLVTDADQALFLNLRGIMDDSNQEVFSAGLGFRTLLEDSGVLLGANVYFDSISTPSGNRFNQLGLGAEALSKWVDFRFNYYLPESGRMYTGSSTSQTSQVYTERSGNRINTFRSTTRSTTNFFEEGLKGWNTEVGFLVPGVEKLFDLRLFAGAYGYDNPGAGGNYTGFKARAEARLTRNLFLDLEYWDDKELVGGNWVAGVRFTSAFDLGRLLQGKNPFQESAPTEPRSLRNRFSEQILRSHRVMTGGSAPGPSDTDTSEDVDIISTQVINTTPVVPSSGSGPETPPVAP